jgi:hypothetical protein
MPNATVPTITALSAGHPLVAITALTKVPNIGDAGGSAIASTGPIQLYAGYPAGTATNSVLTVAGIAAVLSTLNTYYAGLSTASKASIGRVEVLVDPAGFRCTVRGADAATVTASLVTVLNNTSNFGPATT